MVEKQVLFRLSDIDSHDEYRICQTHFNTVPNRALCKESLVIGRYSVLPYYHELALDLDSQGCRLVNSYSQHKYIADMGYIEDIKDLTFPTWFDTVYNIPAEESGPFVVKGRTNSRKQEWGTRMFAPTRHDAVRIQCDLLKDSLIGQQGIVFRKYVPLKLLETGITGQPFVNEWRIFYYRHLPLVSGFYWSIASDEVAAKAELSEEGWKVATKASYKLADNVNFFCLDIAETEDGRWVVVEVNDGQMAGLPNTDMAHSLYRNLHKAIHHYEKLPKHT